MSLCVTFTGSTVHYCNSIGALSSWSSSYSDSIFIVFLIPHAGIVSLDRFWQLTFSSFPIQLLDRFPIQHYINFAADEMLLNISLFISYSYINFWEINTSNKLFITLINSVTFDMCFNPIGSSSSSFLPDGFTFSPWTVVLLIVTLSVRTFKTWLKC